MRTHVIEVSVPVVLIILRQLEISVIGCPEGIPDGTRRATDRAANRTMPVRVGEVDGIVEAVGIPIRPDARLRHLPPVGLDEPSQGWVVVSGVEVAQPRFLVVAFADEGFFLLFTEAYRTVVRRDLRVVLAGASGLRGASMRMASVWHAAGKLAGRGGG